MISSSSMHEARHSKQVFWDNPEGWGEGSGRDVQDGETHMHPWVIHVEVWQNPPQSCKEIILQLKLIYQLKKKILSLNLSQLLWNSFWKSICHSSYKQQTFIKQFIQNMCLSLVWLCVNLWTVAHQNSLSVGFCRQEYWSGLLCPSLGNLPHPGINPHPLPLLHISSIIFYASKNKFNT